MIASRPVPQRRNDVIAIIGLILGSTLGIGGTLAWYREHGWI